MIYQGRRQGWKVIDASGSITVIHQDHDYSHLPEGKPHYRLPESGENVRLAGGKRTIFHLEDCDYRLVDGQLKRKQFSGKGSGNMAGAETEFRFSQPVIFCDISPN